MSKRMRAINNIENPINSNEVFVIKKGLIKRYEYIF
jgi:hypothetical protein